MQQNGRVYNIASIFTARRDLHPLVKLVVSGSGLTVPEADILVLLYGARYLAWDDCHVRADGFVSFKELKSVVVNDPSLFTRRISRLSSPSEQLIEVRRSKDVGPELRGNSRFVRITEKGKEKAKWIWDRYSKFANTTLKGVSQSDLEAHLRVNEGISKVLREWIDIDKWLARMFE